MYLGTRQELVGAIKHHSIEELRGQLASLLTKFPNGVLLSVLRNIFRDHFSHDLDEREYGEYSSMEDLIIKALPDIVRLDTLPQAGSDMLILPVTPSPGLAESVTNTTTPNTNTSINTDTSTTTNMSAETADPLPQHPTDSHEHVSIFDEPKPKSETNPNTPKPKATDLIFQDKPKPLPRSVVAIKVKPKVKQQPRQPQQPQQPQHMFALVSSDYD